MLLIAPVPGGGETGTGWMNEGMKAILILKIPELEHYFDFVYIFHSLFNSQVVDKNLSSSFPHVTLPSSYLVYAFHYFNPM